MRRVLIHTLIFSPDGVSTAYLYNDIALRLQESGYEVIVLTTTPHFNIVPEQVAMQPMRWKIWGLCKESNYHGITVLHVPQKKYKSTALRLLGFVYWHIVSFVLGLTVRRVDLILSPSPPLTIGWLSLGLARLKRCKVVYNVQEIYPDILKLKDGAALRFLRWIEQRVYNGSDAVTTIDRVFYDTIVNRFKDRSKLRIIPNFVDTELYHKVDWTGKLDKTLFPDNSSIKLLYAGNIGHMQSWEALILLAERTADLDLEYFVIGEGAQRGFVEEQVRQRGLEKVHMLPYQPRERMPLILSYSDVSFIFMAPKQDSDGFPSKVYTIMACEKPMLIMSGENTPIVNFLRDKGCAELVTGQNLDENITVMEAWLRSVTKEELKSMGKNGLHVIEEQFTKEKVTSYYVDLVDSLVK